MAYTKKQEEQIQKLMYYLKISRDEAIAEMLEDEKVDKMTSIKEINSDLNEEQKKTSKEMRTATSVDAYGKKRTREKKADNDKAQIIDFMVDALEKAGIVLSVDNPEREISFTFNERKFKLTLSAPRS